MARCKICKDKFEPKYFLQKSCLNPACLAEWIKLDREAKTKQQQRQNNKAKQVQVKKEKALKSKDKQRLKELMSRGAWCKKLQTVKNQWVTKVRDVGKPCSTCGTENPNIKYDCGHYIAVGKNMDLRFELTNMHIQCSQKCNVFGRGMPVEYDEFIINKYGEGHYNWLNTKFLCHKPHPTLREQFPTWQDIEQEILYYRRLLRNAGLKPNA